MILYLSIMVLGAIALIILPMMAFKTIINENITVVTYRQIPFIDVYLVLLASEIILITMLAIDFIKQL